MMPYASSSYRSIASAGWTVTARRAGGKEANFRARASAVAFVLLLSPAILLVTPAFVEKAALTVESVR